MRTAVYVWIIQTLYHSGVIPVKRVSYVNPASNHSKRDFIVAPVVEQIDIKNRIIKKTLKKL